MTTSEKIALKTQWGYAATRILDTPFWGLYALLPFILYRDLAASPLQIALLVTLKPLSSLLSSYWGSFVYNRPDRLITNIIWGRRLSYLPYFFFPFIDNPWFFIFAHGFYMMLAVGTIPAWMEVLKRNLSQEKRENLFSYCQVFGYLGGGLFPFVIGYFLDGYKESWRWLFPITASFGLIALFFQKKMVVDRGGDREPIAPTSPKIAEKVVDRLTAPWKTSFRLLKQRTDFTQFQIAFMLFGSGLMMLQPALPVFFVDTLKLSYTEMAVAITFCKGIGYAITSPLLSKMLREHKIFLFSAWIAFMACLFPLFLLLAQWQILWLYFAYILYGVTQSGSEFSWNMSGPLFSRDQDSSLYSSVNVIAVGVRGAIIPPLGSLILLMSNPLVTMVLGGGLCFFGALSLRRSASSVKSAA